MAFELANVRPIGAMTNKRQAENFGDSRAPNVRAKIGAKEYRRLQIMADDLLAKHTLYDEKYYQKIYNEYFGLCVHEFAVRGIKLPPLLKKLYTK